MTAVIRTEGLTKVFVSNWRRARTIAVDIRYVLFIAKYLGKADFLLKELGV